jgi:hypothetical protein
MKKTVIILAGLLIATSLMAQDYKLVAMTLKTRKDNVWSDWGERCPLMGTLNIDIDNRRIEINNESLERIDVYYIVDIEEGEGFNLICLDSKKLKSDMSLVKHDGKYFLWIKYKTYQVLYLIE